MTPGPLAQILNWLREGYPEGVPPKDYSPLLALLRRTLSEEEFADVLIALEAADADPVRLSHIRAAITDVTSAPPSDDDVRAVAARLAAAGWPLSDGALRLMHAGDGGGAESEVSVLSQVMRWLSAGYPEGIPATDRLPILALLRRRLTDEEVRTVADVLIAQAKPGTELSATDAQVLITRALNDLPDEADIDRVRQHLGASGWQLV